MVQSKTRAATKWCRSATEHATSNGGKPWAYLLIPDDQILANASLAGLSAKFAAG
jgi:type III restriction enzyme